VYPSAEPTVQFKDHDFKTPSGKIEFSGKRFVVAGLPFAPSPIAEKRPSTGEFRMLSPASEWLMNSSYANDGKILRQLKFRDAWLNPLDAAAVGVTDGSLVRVHSKTGSIELRIGLSSDVPQGVLLAPKGQWPKSSTSHANINILNPGEKSDLAESCAVHSIDVSIVTSSPKVIDALQTVNSPLAD
jgi:anaerobic selenocysteine-containing dehydrogenase